METRPMHKFDEMYIHWPEAGQAQFAAPGQSQFQGQSQGGRTQLQVQAVRDHYKGYAQWLARQPQEAMRARREEAEMIFRRVGITFAVYGAQDEDGAGTEGPSPLPP